MKKTICSLLFLSTYLLGQQIDSSKLDFFPLHKGDTWQYGTIVYPAMLQPPSPPFFVSVVDTLLQNGQRYAGLSYVATPDKIFKFLRVDSFLRVQEYSPSLGDSCGGSSGELNTYRLGEKDSTAWCVCTNMGVAYFPQKSLVRFNRIVFDSTVMEFQIGLPETSSHMWNPEPFWLTRGVGITGTNDGDGRDYYLVGAIINGKQIGNPIVFVSDKPELSAKYSLSHNYPNPFNPNTTISYSIPFQSHVRITVFNSIGEVVATLVDASQPAGSYTAVWNGSRYSSGIYFCQMRAGFFIQTQKFVLTK